MRVTPFLGMNILIEILAPFLVLLLLWRIPLPWVGQVVDPYLFGTILTLAGFVTLIGFYAPSVFFMNIRRFPRVTKKAFFTVLIPLLIAGLLWLISPLPLMYWLFIAGTHYVSAILIAAMVESVQVSHSRAYPLAPMVKYVFLILSFVTVLGLNVIALPIFLSTAAGFMIWILAAIWFLTMMELALTKYYRAGFHYLAKRGYRPNAAVIVMNELGQVLLCERADRPGTIQTVQGGIDPGERPAQAAARELMEELGLMPNDYEIVAHLLETAAYDWSRKVQKQLEKTGYKGQEQYFFLARVPSTIEFHLGMHEREFRRVWWGDAEDLLRLTWSPKRPGIEKALKGFGLL